MVEDEAAVVEDEGAGSLAADNLPAVDFPVVVDAASLASPILAAAIPAAEVAITTAVAAAIPAADVVTMAGKAITVVAGAVTTVGVVMVVTMAADAAIIVRRAS